MSINSAYKRNIGVLLKNIDYEKTPVWRQQGTLLLHIFKMSFLFICEQNVCSWKWPCRPFVSVDFLHDTTWSTLVVWKMPGSGTKYRGFAQPGGRCPLEWAVTSPYCFQSPMSLYTVPGEYPLYRGAQIKLSPEDKGPRHSYSWAFLPSWPVSKFRTLRVSSTASFYMWHMKGNHVKWSICSPSSFAESKWMGLCLWVI